MAIKTIFKHTALNELSPAGSSFHLSNFSVFTVDFSIPENREAKPFEVGLRTDFFTIVYVKKGTLVFKINFQKHTIEEGSIFITSPNQVKQMVHVSDDCLMQGVSFTSNFFIEFEFPKNVLDIMEFFLPKYASVWQVTKEEGHIFHKAIEALGFRVNTMPAHIYGKELLGTCFLSFLYELAEITTLHATTTSHAFGRKEDLVYKFSKMAARHHITERSVTYYSRHLYVSSKYLSETVKEITGKTAGEFIDELNILEAKRLLENPGLSVADISFALQFSTPAFFSKFFKRLSGQSPKAFRLAQFNK